MDFKIEQKCNNHGIRSEGKGRNRYGSELYVEGRLSEAEEEKTYWAIIYQYDWYVFGKRIKEDASGVEEVYGTKEEALDQLEKWKKRNMKTSK